MEKIRILADSPDPNDETAHLRPIIEFLKEQGNEPEKMDKFIFDRDGFGEYKFKYSINWDAVDKAFELPESILISRINILDDKKNLLRIISG